MATTGELALTTYNAGDKPWSHTTGLQAIDNAVSKIMQGLLNKAAKTSTSASGTINLVGSTDAANTPVWIITGGGQTLTTITNGNSNSFLFLYFVNQSSADTIQHGVGANLIALHGSADWQPDTGSWIILYNDGTQYREVVRMGPGGIVTELLEDLGVTTGKIANNAVGQSQMAAGAVGTSQLKTLTATGSGVSSVTLSNTYHFLPMVAYTSASAARLTISVSSGTGTTGADSGAERLHLDWGNSNSSYTVRYVSSSPPHFIAGVRWGMFLFLILDSDDNICGSWLSADPPWDLGPGGRWPKGDKRKIASLPHPFTQVPDGHRVVLVDTRQEDLEVVDYSEKLVRAAVDEDDARSGKYSVEVSADLLVAARDARSSAETDPGTVKIEAWDALMRRCELTGERPHELVIARYDGFAPSALRSGIPEFDSVVSIVSPVKKG